MLKLSSLIFKMCPEAVFEDIVDIYPEPQKERKLSFSAERISGILGKEVSGSEIKEILKRYNFEYTEKGGNFEIVVPKMRLDLVVEEDMAEEIGRVVGYDKLALVMPKINFTPQVNETYAKISKARNKLLGEGYSEVMTYVFRDKGKVEVMQSASDKKFLRVNLADGLKESLALNKINSSLLGLKEARPGQDGGVKIFEIGAVWNPKEEIHVAYNEKDKIIEMTLEDFIKASPDAFARDYPASQRHHSQKHTGLAFTMWSLFPFISRDIAVWVPEGTSAEEIQKIIKEDMGDMVVRGPELFDEFSKDGKKSYAFRLVFQSFERTLTDAEINEIMAKITNEIKANSAWQVR